MELDDMKQAWARMELRQEHMDEILRAGVRERRVEKVRAGLRWSLANRLLELAVWTAYTVCIASFWVDHRHVLHWLVIGLLLHAYGIAGIWASATHLLLASRIYLFDAPVLVLQRRLAQLRRFGVWCTLALGLPWWFLWLLIPMVGVEWFAGVDLFAASPGWIWANLAVGVAGIAISVWLARRIARRTLRPAWLQRIVDDMSGCNLRRAARQIDELARFEREQP